MKYNMEIEKLFVVKLIIEHIQKEHFKFLEDLKHKFQVIELNKESNFSKKQDIFTYYCKTNFAAKDLQKEIRTKFKHINF